MYDTAPSNDIKIVVDDFNAKIGQEEVHQETTAYTRNSMTTEHES